MRGRGIATEKRKTTHVPFQTARKTQKDKKRELRPHSAQGHCPESYNLSCRLRRHHIDFALVRRPLPSRILGASHRMRMRRTGWPRGTNAKSQLETRCGTGFACRFRQFRCSPCDVYVLLAHRRSHSRGSRPDARPHHSRFGTVLRDVRLLPSRPLQHDARTAHTSLLETLLPRSPRPRRRVDGAVTRSAGVRARCQGNVSRVAYRAAEPLLRQFHALFHRIAHGLPPSNHLAEVRPHKQAVPTAGNGRSLSDHSVPGGRFLAHHRSRGNTLHLHGSRHRIHIPQIESPLRAASRPGKAEIFSNTKTTSPRRQRGSVTTKTALEKLAAAPGASSVSASPAGL